MRRVVVTGMGGITALGNTWPEIRAPMFQGKTAVRYMPEWERFESISTRLGAPIDGFSVYALYPRKKTRTMGPVSKLAVRATDLALKSAGLESDPAITNGRTCIAYGSSFGSPDPVLGFAELKMHGTSKKLSATSYVQMMSHTAAVNIGLFFGITGRIIPTSSACTSGSQGIGYAYEAIRWGRADLAIAGGAEEIDITQSAVFDTLFATSTRNDRPKTTPRPFDRDRDGLVIGEGAATLILEERERAMARGATICAEIVGFACNSDGNHVTQPQAGTMARSLRLALEDAGLDAGAIGFISGHGTATDTGDMAESKATNEVMGTHVPIHSLKSYLGHTLGACGAIETWLAIEMMREGRFAATANLENPDPKCAELDHIMGKPRRADVEHIMCNNFAFGGINTSIVVRNIR